MATVKLVTLRIHNETMVPLEPTVRAHEADDIFDAWLGDAPEVVIPAANGATLPLTREEIRTHAEYLGEALFQETRREPVGGIARPVTVEIVPVGGDPLPRLRVVDHTLEHPAVGVDPRAHDHLGSRRVRKPGFDDLDQPGQAEIPGDHLAKRRAQVGVSIERQDGYGNPPRSLAKNLERDFVLGRDGGGQEEEQDQAGGSQCVTPGSGK